MTITKIIIGKPIKKIKIKKNIHLIYYKKNLNKYTKRKKNSFQINISVNMNIKQNQILYD